MLCACDASVLIICWGYFLHQPDPDKASREEEAEKEILKKLKASMTEEDLAELARATQELRLKQETPDPPEALKSVPSLSLLDIPKEPIHIPTEVVMTFSNSCLNFLHGFFCFSVIEHTEHFVHCRLGI